MTISKKSKKQITSRLQAAWRHLKETQKQYATLREEHLEELAEFYAEHRNITKAQDVKQIQHIEGIKRVAAKHQWYLKGQQGMLQRLLVQQFLVHKMVPVY